MVISTKVNSPRRVVVVVELPLVKWPFEPMLSILKHGLERYSWDENDMGT